MMFRIHENKPVIVWILEFISRLLSPEFAQSDAITNLGSLISKLILTVPSSLPSFPLHSTLFYTSTSTSTSTQNWVYVCCTYAVY
jgi:hypothetical protein